MNTIIIELCAEDRARIDRLTAALETHTGQACAASVGKMCADMCDVMAAASPAAEPAEPIPEESPAASADFPAPAHTAEDIQKKIVELATTGKKAAARAVVNRYAERVSGIPADKLDEVMEQLNAL